MKTVNLGILLALTALNASPQGTVRFENHIPGVLVTHVYAPKPPASAILYGNGPNDYPPGDRYWLDWTPAAGSGFSAQLLGAPGANLDVSSLSPVSPITTFQTGDNAGFVVPLIATLEGIPADAPVASLIMVAWDNQNGTVNTVFDAIYHSPGWWGAGASFNVYNIGGAVNPPPVLSGLRSFSMGEFIALPEPSVSSLMVGGLAALLAYHGSQVRKSARATLRGS